MSVHQRQVYNCDSLLAGLSLFDRMSSKVLHSHCDSDEKVVPEELVTLASFLHKCSTFFIGWFCSCFLTFILFSAFALNALCHLCITYCLISPITHDTARGAPELGRMPSYPVTVLKEKRLNIPGFPFKWIHSKIWSLKRARIPYD